jgi:hypothetical protein
MKYSRTYLLEVQDELMRLTDTKLLINAIRVIQSRFKLLAQYKEKLDAFSKAMGCDNYPNAMRSLKRLFKEFQDAKDLIEEIRVISGARHTQSITRIVRSRFIGEYPDWLEVPSPFWKGKEKASSKIWHKNSKDAYKKMLVWFDDNPDDKEKIMEEARLTYLCGSATTFISSCERLYLLAKMVEFGEIEAQYNRMKKLGGDPNKTFNYRSARVLRLRDADGDDGAGSDDDDIEDDTDGGNGWYGTGGDDDADDAGSDDDDIEEDTDGNDGWYGTGGDDGNDDDDNDED